MDASFKCIYKPYDTGENRITAFMYSDYSIEAHSHEFFEINIVMRGTATHQIEDACVKAKPGNVFVIPPNVVHSYYDSKNLDVYHILLRPDFIYTNRIESDKMPGFIQFFEIEPFLRQHLSDSVFLCLSGTQLLQLKSDISFIANNGIYNSREFMPLKEHTTWKILYWLSHLHYVQLHKNTSDELGKYEYAILKSLEYIHQNYERKITIDTLCRLTFLSRSTFLRSFNDICQCSPLQYLNNYRCKKALELANNTELSKTDIAHHCGFYDLSHMERVFKMQDISI